MFFNKAVSAGGSQYVDRGDPDTGWDFALGDLTTDDTWNDLDLSSIVPAGAVAVNLAIQINDDISDSSIHFRKNGNINADTIISSRTQVASIILEKSFIVGCDTDRIVEYNANAVTWVTINIMVLGWWIN